MEETRRCIVHLDDRGKYVYRMGVVILGPLLSHSPPHSPTHSFLPSNMQHLDHPPTFSPSFAHHRCRLAIRPAVNVHFHPQSSPFRPHPLPHILRLVLRDRLKSASHSGFDI